MIFRTLIATMKFQKFFYIQGAQWARSSDQAAEIQNSTFYESFSIKFGRVVDKSFLFAITRKAQP